MLYLPTMFFVELTGKTVEYASFVTHFFMWQHVIIKELDKRNV